LELHREGHELLRNKNNEIKEVYNRSKPLTNEDLQHLVYILSRRGGEDTKKQMRNWITANACINCKSTENNRMKAWRIA
jgi:hypothetical protein